MPRFLAALAFATALPNLTHAETSDGSLGNTSAGTLDISLSVGPASAGPHIQITGLEPIFFTDELSDQYIGPLVAIPVCVFMTEAGTFDWQIDAQSLFGDKVEWGYWFGVEHPADSRNYSSSYVIYSDKRINIAGSSASAQKNCEDSNPTAIFRSFLFRNVTWAPRLSPGTYSATVSVTVMPSS